MIIITALSVFAIAAIAWLLALFYMTDIISIIDRRHIRQFTPSSSAQIHLTSDWCHIIDNKTDLTLNKASGDTYGVANGHLIYTQLAPHDIEEILVKFDHKHRQINPSQATTCNARQ